MAKIRLKQKMKIICDTNPLYTQSPSEFMRSDIAIFINECVQYKNISIKWYIPELVSCEREYQMSNYAMSYLATIQKVEKLMGKELCIDESTIKLRVKDIIDKTILDNDIELLKLDYSSIEWEHLINSAVNRIPPFDSSEKEKGFKDYIIMETLLQFISSRNEPNNLFVFVSKDQLLISAIQDRTKHLDNIRIVNDIEELKGLVNTLVSQADEKQIKDIIKYAKSYFFKLGVKSTFYYSENIKDVILEKFKQEIEEIPSGADYIEKKKWSISPPVFLKKQRNQYFLRSRIKLELNAFQAIKVTEVPQIKSVNLLLEYIIETQNGGMTKNPIKTKNIYDNLMASLANPKVNAKNGEEIIEMAVKYVIFEVEWSVTIVNKFKFSNPKLENIGILCNSWEYYD